ncbi:flagellar export protein FliJ [Sodalis sp. C49]|uniref:flagellar export protein FliJ n=1 Tax=unclassified Sodalis (in: enterobacteria) TaxID=2636512 RepID=UPI00396590FA
MKSNAPLDVLRERAKEELDKAAIRLGQIRQSHQLARKQLEQLQEYEREYRQKLQRGMTEGMASASWYNYQQFIITLETAIEQHRTLLEQWSLRLQQAVQVWQNKHQRLNALVTLHTRHQQLQLAHDNRQDQKRMDEFAQRACARKHS